MHYVFSLLLFISRRFALFVTICFTVQVKSLYNNSLYNKKRTIWKKQINGKKKKKRKNTTHKFHKFIYLCLFRCNIFFWNNELFSFLHPNVGFQRGHAWFIGGPIYLERRRGKEQRQAGCIKRENVVAGGSGVRGEGGAEGFGKLCVPLEKSRLHPCRLLPKSIPISRLRVHERVAISLAEVL